VLVGGAAGGHTSPGHGDDGRVQHHGRAVQVDPMKPTLKAPGTKRLKPKCHEPLSNFAFKINLRRYTMVGERGLKLSGGEKQRVALARAFLKVRRRSLTLSNPP